MKKLFGICSALVIVAIVISSLPSLAARPIHVVSYGQRDDWAHEVDPWADAVTLTGYATTYDASTHICRGDTCWRPGYGAWWTPTARKADRWVYASAAGCKKHREWQCYWRDFVGSKGERWKSLVRPLTEPITLYAALGPVLQKLIADQNPRWHFLPTNKLRITSLESGLSVEVWIVDTCGCEGYVEVNGKRVHPLLDLPQVGVWEAVDREEYYVDGVRYYRHASTGEPWSSNWITVEYLP